MATSDLLAELSKDSFRAAPDVEKKVVAAVLRQLDDQSGDVSTLAVKCLPPLVKNCSPGSVTDVVNGLVERLCAEEGKVKDARAKRDAGVIGLKTVLAETPVRTTNNASVVVKTLVPKLVAKLSHSLHSGDAAKNTGAAGDVAGDCLDVLHAAAAGHGAYMTVGHDEVVASSSRASDAVADAVSPNASLRAGSSPDGVSAETARELEAALVKYLAESGRPGTRKRAATCLASLGATAGDGFLSRCASAARDVVAEAVSEQRQKPAAERDELCAPYVHMLGAMAHAAGARFGKHAAESLPCVVSLAAAAHEEGSEALRETCLRTLERFAEECPQAVAPSLPAVVEESLKLVSHDPLYGDDDDAEDAEDMDADGGDGGDGYSDDGSEYGSEYDASEYSDDGDDDASWKIRRGATRVLRAVSSKAPFVLEARIKASDAATDQPLFVSVVSKLVACGSRERDESCRLEAFAALEAALRAASPSRGASSSLAAAAAAAAPDVAIAASRWCSDASTTKDKARGVKSTLRTRAAAFGVLTELFLRAPFAFTLTSDENDNENENAKKTLDALGAVAAACAGALTASTGVDGVDGGVQTAVMFDAGNAAGLSELRVAASRFARVFSAARFFEETTFKSNDATRRALLVTLAPPLVAATRDAYYKTAAEAFAACEALVPAFALALGSRDPAREETGATRDALVRTATSLVSAAAEGVAAADRDAEVKAAATRCAGAACATLGPFVSRDVVADAVASLVERLGNEATRLGAAKALSAVFASGKSDDLSHSVAAVSEKAANALRPFTRQADRALRHASLDALAALVARPALGREHADEDEDRSSLLPDEIVAAVVTDAAGCAVDAEPAAAATALRLASTALRRASTLPSSAEAARVSVLPAAVALVKGASASSLFGAKSRKKSRAKTVPLTGASFSPLGDDEEKNGDKNSVVDTPRSLLCALRFFFASLVTSGSCDHATILELLLRESTDTTDGAKNGDASVSFSSRDAGAVAVAECASAACASAGGTAVADAAKELVSRIEADTQKSGGFGYSSRLAMYCLGELARVPPEEKTSVASDDADTKNSKKKQKKASVETPSSRSAFGDDAVAASFEALVRDAFETRVDESFLTAAAFALGGACAGVADRARFLPVVVAGASSSSSDARASYAFLVSAREAVRNTSSSFTETETKSLVECLLQNAEKTRAEEEGARAVVAECLGRLAARDENAALVARLEADANDANAAAGRRAVAVDAAKHALTHARVSETLDLMPRFVNETTLAKDTDARTRVAAMRALSAAAHADADALCSSRLADWIARVAPALFAQTPVDASLVRVVDLGPFKHTVDDGLETRKAAFECLATLLDAFRESAEIQTEIARGEEDFLARAPSGFARGVAAAAALGAADHYDVKIVAHGLVCALAKGSPLGTEALREVLPDLCVALRGTLTAKLKSDAVKQEMDRADDLARSCLRAVAATHARLFTSGAETDPAFRAFLAEAVMTEKHGKMFEDAVVAFAEEEGVARA